VRESNGEFYANGGIQVLKQEILTRIQRTGIIPVLRAPSTEEALAIVEALAAGGIDVIEVTMTVPGAVDVIRKLRRARADLLIGAGTVLDPENARVCMQEGAQFIVTPVTNLATIEICQKHSIAVFPGALTPTEIFTAWQAGGDAIKVFPASAMGGAPYLRSLKAPLPQVELIPTGGISVATAVDFLRAGAFALGVGADLCGSTAIAEGKPERITQTAREYLQVIAAFRAATDA
jgi:2-dehydro-3-deoxyphosphogluconate aldolase / (4S)-4-hydroxy-2-oxoglutarate aldolase